ncbi:MAG: flagellar hook-associated protein FlgK [Bryobacteraceae bacterium]
MGSLFASLVNSTGALQVYGRVFNVIQNNVTNVNTPGYVEQEQSLVPMPFDPAGGLTGGVLPGRMLSARSSYLEQSVRNQQQLLGDAQQRAGDLSQIESLFDTGGETGVSGALNDFFNSFSQLAVNPNDIVSRQNVIEAAGKLSQAFNQNAIGITRVSNNVDGETRDTVTAINSLTKQIAEINSHFRSNADSAGDAGLDALMHSSLEKLSGLVNYSLVKTSDGSYTLYAGGQTPLVIGDHVYPLSADFSNPTTVIRDALGRDVTSQLEGLGGTLGAMLEEKNGTLVGYKTALDSVASAVADSVNAQLSQGVDRNGNAPQKNLFSYSPTLGSAFTLSVTDITPDEIAAALPSAPGGNGNAVALAQLALQPSVGGFTFTQAYGNLGGLVGRDIAQAKQDQSTQQDLVTQAQAARAAASGVSLDKEAAKLLQFQQAYQAVGKMVGVLNTLTDTVLNILR